MERGGNVLGINQWNKIIFSKTILISPPPPFLNVVVVGSGEKCGKFPEQVRIRTLYSRNDCCC